MPSKSKTVFQDNFQITAQLFPPGALSSKIKSHAVIVEIEFANELWQKVNQIGKNVYVVCDLSDSIPQALNQMTSYLSDVVKRVDLRKDRVLIFSLGEVESLYLSQNKEANISDYFQQLAASQRNHYRKMGTFINPTLQSIEQDCKRNSAGYDQPLLIIFSDGEIWDWELYRDFLQQNHQFRVGFFEVKEHQNNTPIARKVREVNRQYSVISGQTNQQLTGRLTDVLLVQSSEIAFIEKILLNLHFYGVEPSCIIDFCDEIRSLDQERYRFEWISRESGLAKKFFQRLYFFPAKPESVTIEGQLAKSPGPEVTTDEFFIKLVPDSKILKDILPDDNDCRWFIQEVEKIYSQCTKWFWDINLLEKLMSSVIDNRNLSKKEFRIICPNPDCNVENKPYDWIAKVNPMIRCRACRQILAHTSKLLTTDPKLGNATVLLLEIHIAPKGEIELNDEPVCIKKEQEIANFKIYGNEKKIEVLTGELEYYSLKTSANELRYESRTISRDDPLLQPLFTFDVLKPVPGHSNASIPLIYYMFLNISQLI